MRNTALTVIAGTLARDAKPRGPQVQDAIAKRWRVGTTGVVEPTIETPDVISLLDGWIRRLEREAGSASAIELR